MQIINNACINLKSFVKIALIPEDFTGKITNLFFWIFASYNIGSLVYRKFIATPLASDNFSSSEKIEIEKLIHTATPNSLRKAFDKLKDKYAYNLWEKLLLNVLVVDKDQLLGYLVGCPAEHKLEISKKLGALAQVFNDEEFSKSVLKQIVALEIKQIEDQVKDASKVSQLINKYQEYTRHQKRNRLFYDFFKLNQDYEVKDDFISLKEIETFLRFELSKSVVEQQELSSIKEKINEATACRKLEKKITKIEKNKINLKKAITTIFNGEKHDKTSLLLILNKSAQDYHFFDNLFDRDQFYYKAKDIAQKLPETNEVEVKEKLESYLKIAEVLSNCDEIDDDFGNKVRTLCGRIKKNDYALNMVGYFAELSNVFKAADFDVQTQSKEWLLNLAFEVVINAQVFCNNKQLEYGVRLSEAIYRNGNMCSVLSSILVKIKENYQFLQPKNKEELKEKIRLLCRYLRVYDSFDTSPKETITTFYNHVTSDKFFKDLSSVEQIEVGLQTLDIFFGNYDIKNSFLLNNSCLELALPIFNSIKKLPPKTFTECQVKMQFMQKIFLLDLQFALNIYSREQFQRDMLALAGCAPSFKNQMDLYSDVMCFYIKNKNKKHLEEKFDHLNFNCEERAGEVFLRAYEIFSHIDRLALMNPEEKVPLLEKLAALRGMISIELLFKGKVITASDLIEEAFKEAKNIEDPLLEKPLPQSSLSILSFGPSHVEPKSDIYIRLAKRMNLLKMDIHPIVTAICEIQYNTEQVDLEVFHLCRAVEELDKIIDDENKETLQKPILEKVEVRLKEAVDQAITLTEIERLLNGYKFFHNTLSELTPELEVYDPDVQDPYESYGTFPFDSIYMALNKLPQENIAKITELKAKAIHLSPEVKRGEQIKGLLNEVINYPTKTIHDVESKYKALSQLFVFCFDINCLDVFLQSLLFSDTYFEAISSQYKMKKMKELLLTIPTKFKEKMSSERYFYIHKVGERMYQVSNLFKKFEKLDLTPLERAEAYVAFTENIEGLATVDQLLDISKKIHDNLILIAPGQEFKNLMEKVNRIEIQLNLLKQEDWISDSTSSSSEEPPQISSTDGPSSCQENDSFVITNDPVLIEKLKKSDEVISWNKVKSAAILFIASWALARIMAKTTINLGCRFFTIINGTPVSVY